MLIVYYANYGQIWDLSYWAQCQWHLWMGRHSWEVALQHMRVCCDVSVFNREQRLCVYVCLVCCGWWNSIRQMGLFRVLSLLPKKGPICFSIFANNTHQYVQHISILLTFFSIHFSCFCFFFAFCFHWLQPLMKTNRTWAPFTATKWTWETHNRGVLQVSREGKAWTFSARLLLQGLLCSAWQWKQVMEQTAGASVEKGENRDDPPVPGLSKGWLSQSCVVF